MILLIYCRTQVVLIVPELYYGKRDGQYSRMMSTTLPIMIYDSIPIDL